MVREGVQRPGAGRGQRGDGGVVVSLIKKAAGLAVGHQIGLQPVFAQAIDDARVAAAGHDAGKARQALEVAHRSVVARHDDADAQSFGDQRGDGRAGGVHGHRGGLDDGGVGIAIDEQPGEAVALGVADAKGVAIQAQALPAGQGGAQAPVDDRQQVAPGDRVGGAGAGLEQAQGQLGPRRPGGHAQRLAAPVLDDDQRRAAVAGVTVGPVRDVLAEDPGVAGADAGGAARGDHGAGKGRRRLRVGHVGLHGGGHCGGRSRGGRRGGR